jgi:hypothetical protein
LPATAEAEEHAGQDGEGCEDLKRRDRARAGQRDGGQCGDGDQPVEQPGAVYPEAFHGRVPGEDHDGGDRDREVGQRGQLGRGGYAQDRWPAREAGHGGGGQQQDAGQAAGVDRDGQCAEPRQHRCGQQGCAHGATERPGRQQQPRSAPRGSGGAAELGHCGSGGYHGCGEQGPAGGAMARGGRGGDDDDQRGCSDDDPDTGGIGRPGGQNQQHAAPGQPDDGQPGQPRPFPACRARQGRAPQPRPGGQEKPCRQVTALAAQHRIAAQQAGRGHGTADHQHRPSRQPGADALLPVQTIHEAQPQARKALAEVAEYG